MIKDARNPSNISRKVLQLASMIKGSSHIRVVCISPAYLDRVVYGRAILAKSWMMLQSSDGAGLSFSLILGPAMKQTGVSSPLECMHGMPATSAIPTFL